MTASEAQYTGNGVTPTIGPHPSFIQVAKPYVFEQSLQQCRTDVGATEAREDTIRLQGVTWIDNVRKALHLPVRTYNTACVYYHKFRLVHPDNEYDYRDAAAAALFNACKIEDTLKKSRDILCAAYNLKLAPSEHLSSDDPLFEQHSKTIVGLERLMLEASGFDFRNRYPQKMLMKLVKSCNLDRDVAGMTAYKICLDLYRTFAPLKQTTQTMALACLELAIRLCNIDLATVTTKYGFDYDRWATTREEVMETLVDALELYIHHRVATLIGPDYTLDAFIAVRITLNHEASDNNYPRFTEWNESHEKEEQKSEVKAANGTSNGSATISPQSPSTGVAGERGKDGTIRFMLDPTRARDEKSTVKEFFEPPKEVEEWVWVEVSNNNPLDDEEASSQPIEEKTMIQSSDDSIRSLKEQLAKLGNVVQKGARRIRESAHDSLPGGQGTTSDTEVRMDETSPNETQLYARSIIDTTTSLPQLRDSGNSDNQDIFKGPPSSIELEAIHDEIIESIIASAPLQPPQGSFKKKSKPKSRNKESTGSNPNKIPIAPRSMRNPHSSVAATPPHHASSLAPTYGARSAPPPPPSFAPPPSPQQLVPDRSRLRGGHRSNGVFHQPAPSSSSPVESPYSPPSPPYQSPPRSPEREDEFSVRWEEVEAHGVKRAFGQVD